MASSPSRQTQAEIFTAEPLPSGIVYQPDFLSATEERQLVAAIAALSLQAAR